MREYSLSCLSHISSLSDGALTGALKASLSQEAGAIATVLAHIAEFDARQLYRQAAQPSMYSYCLHVLHLSEGGAYKRIQAARAARQFPAIFTALADSRLHLTGVVTLKPHLTPENFEELLAAATHKTRAEIEWLLAQRFPRPDLPERVRALLPAPGPPMPVDLEARSATGLTPELTLEAVTTGVSSHEQSASEPGPGRAELSESSDNQPATTPVGQPESVSGDELSPGRVGMTTLGQRITPLAPRRYGIQFTFDEAECEKLRRVQDLLGNQVAAGSVAVVFSRALDALERELQKSKCAATARPRPQRRGRSARHIPAEVKRRVRERDGGQCTFVSDQGQRCPARRALEYDHMDPVGRGGGTPTVSRIRLRCRAHNQLDAERTYGAEFMRHKRESAQQARAARRETRFAPTQVTSQVS